MLTSLFNFRTPESTKRKWDSTETVDEEDESFEIVDNLQTPPKKRACQGQPQENTTPFGKVSTWFKQTVRTTARNTARLFRSFADRYNLWQTDDDDNDEDNGVISSPFYTRQYSDIRQIDQELSTSNMMNEEEERSALYYSAWSPVETNHLRRSYPSTSYYSRPSIHDIDVRKSRAEYDPSRYDSRRTRDTRTNNQWSIHSSDTDPEVKPRTSSQKLYPKHKQSDSSISSSSSHVYQTLKNSPPVKMLNEVVRLAERDKYRELLAQYTLLKQNTDQNADYRPKDRRPHDSRANMTHSRTRQRHEKSLVGPSQSVERLHSGGTNNSRPMRIHISPAKTKEIDVHMTDKSPLDSKMASQQLHKPATHVRRSVDIFDDNWIKKWRETLSSENIEKERKIAKEKLKLESLRKAENEKLKRISDEVKARMQGKQPDSTDEKIDSFPKLSSQMNCMVDKALGRGAPNEVLVETSVGKITRADIATLGQQNWLNDEIVNTYFQLLADRSQKTTSKIHTFNTFFYSKLIKTGHSSLRRWTKKVDLFQMDMILIPIHLGMHWCLAVIDFKTKVISYYDSLKGENNQCLQALRDYLCAESLDKKKQTFDMTGWKCDTPKNIPEQMNGCDCGVFVCKYAEYLSRRASFDFTQYHMPYFRRRMVYEILSKSLM